MFITWIAAQLADTRIGFWNFDVGNVAIVLGLLLQGAVLYANSNRQHGENKERISELLRWKDGHDLDAKQRDEAIVQLREIAAGMKATADGTLRQLQLLQQEMREMRKRG